MGIRTYIDSCVFINLVSNTVSKAERALAVVEDKNRDIIISDYVKLEVRPKMYYNGYLEQLSYVDAVFQNFVCAACKEAVPFKA